MTCCGALFCRACIAPVTATRTPKCPMCRAACGPDKVVTDVRSERASKNTTRPCRHAAHGCTFIGPRNDVALHEPNCAHLPRSDLVNENSNLKKENSRLKEQLTERDERISRKIRRPLVALSYAFICAQIWSPSTLLALMMVSLCAALAGCNEEEEEA